MNITYVGGAGRLGLPLAAWSAHKGHEVIVADINTEEVDRINEGHTGRYEPQVDELVAQALQENSLYATTDIASAVAQSELICIIVPTPSLTGGGFSNEYVLDACQAIGEGLQDNDRPYPVVEISSTVMPGSTMGPIRTTLENSSSRVTGTDFGLVYSPEFIRQGSIVHDFANPDMVLMGVSDARSADVVWEYYESVVENGAPFHVMSVVSAEIAKLSLNATVVAKMAMANTIAALCHDTSGADAYDVLKVIGEDSRIGHKFFGAGTWPGGPCFPRDTWALRLALEEAAVPTLMVEGAGRQSAEMSLWLARHITGLAGGKKAVGILGLAYKPGVDIIEESQGMELARRLEKRHVPVYTHDPVVRDPRSTRQRDLRCLVHWSNILVLMTCWPEYRALLDMDLSGKIVLDMWGFLEELDEAPVLYYRFGKGL